MKTLHISVACLIDNTGRLLVVRKQGTAFWMLPGGKMQGEETPFATLQRELQEELALALDERTTTYLGHFEAQAANEPDHRVNAHAFYARYDGMLTPLAELEALEWMYPAHLPQEKTASLLKEAVLPALMCVLATNSAA